MAGITRTKLVGLEAISTRDANEAKWPPAALSSGGDLTHGETGAVVFLTVNPSGELASYLSKVRISKRLAQPLRTFFREGRITVA